MAEVGIGSAAVAGIVVGVAALASLAGAGIATYGAIRQSREAQAQAKGLQQQKELEARVAKENAEFDEQQHRRRVRMLQGEQSAMLAAAGVDTASGTPLINDVDIATQGELEALMIKRRGIAGGEERTFESELLGRRARALRSAEGLTLAGGAISGLSGLTSAASSYAQSYRPTTQKVS